MGYLHLVEEPSTFGASGWWHLGKWRICRGNSWVVAKTAISLYEVEVTTIRNYIMRMWRYIFLTMHNTISFLHIINSDPLTVERHYCVRILEKLYSSFISWWNNNNNMFVVDPLFTCGEQWTEWERVLKLANILALEGSRSIFFLQLTVTQLTVNLLRCITECVPRMIDSEVGVLRQRFDPLLLCGDTEHHHNNIILSYIRHRLITVSVSRCFHTVSIVVVWSMCLDPLIKSTILHSNTILSLFWSQQKSSK